MVLSVYLYYMKNQVQAASCSGGAVYGMGVIGALFYYLPHAANFSEGIWGVVRALFWPAFFVYKAIEMFHI
jgi:hypothetical protein